MRPCLQGPLHIPPKGNVILYEQKAKKIKIMMILYLTLPLVLVFAGLVAWTEKTTETELNATKSNQALSCSCLIWELVRLLIALIFRYSKTDKRPITISCNQSFSCIYYIQYIQL